VANRRRAGAPSPLLLTGVLVAFLLCLGLWAGPGFVDGLLAARWTQHLAERNAVTPRVADARPAGRWAARAVDGLAPLPLAWETARLALQMGQRMQPKDGAAARALLSQVRESLDRAQASPWRRLGLGTLRDEVWQAENSLAMAPGP